MANLIRNYLKRKRHNLSTRPCGYWPFVADAIANLLPSKLLKMKGHRSLLLHRPYPTSLDYVHLVFILYYPLLRLHL